jgi:hypothetical protein
MKIETRTEPPEPDVDDDGGDGDEPTIMVHVSIYTPGASHMASANIPAESPLPNLATALRACMRGVAWTHGPVLGEIMNALLVDTGANAGVWLNCPDSEVAALPADERLTLGALANGGPRRAAGLPSERAGRTHPPVPARISAVPPGALAGGRADVRQLPAPAEGSGHRGAGPVFSRPGSRLAQ